MTVTADAAKEQTHLKLHTTIASSQEGTCRAAMPWHEVWGRFTALWKARSPRSLRVTETVTLGERRFLALVACGKQKFLIGGTSTALVLLARLNAENEEVSCG